MKIKNEDKARVLVALYNGSFAQNMGLLSFRPGSLTVDEAEKVLARRRGRPGRHFARA